MPYRAQAEAVLTEWREVERKLAASAPGSAEAEALRAEAVRLRDGYQALIEASRAALAVEPPPFPEPPEPS